MLDGETVSDDDRWELYDVARRPDRVRRPGRGRARATPDRWSICGGPRPRPIRCCRSTRCRSSRRSAASRCRRPGRATSTGPAPGRSTRPAPSTCGQRSHEVVVDVDIPSPADSTEGVLVSQGSGFGGWVLWLSGGRLHYAHNFVSMEEARVVADLPVTPGRHSLGVRYHHGGGSDGADGVATLVIDGETAGSVEVPRFTLTRWSITGDGLTVGHSMALPVVRRLPLAVPVHRHHPAGGDRRRRRTGGRHRRPGRAVDAGPVSEAGEPRRHARRRSRSGTRPARTGPGRRLDVHLRRTRRAGASVGRHPGSAGVGPGDRVALFDWGGVRSTAATLAAAHIGAATSQMNPLLTTASWLSSSRSRAAAPSPWPGRMGPTRSPRARVHRHGARRTDGPGRRPTAGLPAPVEATTPPSCCSPAARPGRRRRCRTRTRRCGSASGPTGPRSTPVGRRPCR